MDPFLAEFPVQQTWAEDVAHLLPRWAEDVAGQYKKLWQISQEKMLLAQPAQLGLSKLPQERCSSLRWRKTPASATVDQVALFRMTRCRYRSPLGLPIHALGTVGFESCLQLSVAIYLDCILISYISKGHQLQIWQRMCFP